MAGKKSFDPVMHGKWSQQIEEYRSAAATIRARKLAEAEAEILALSIEVQGGVVKEFLRLKNEGNYYAKSIVCNSVGISKPTLDNWIQKMKDAMVYDSLVTGVNSEEVTPEYEILSNAWGDFFVSPLYPHPVRPKGRYGLFEEWSNRKWGDGQEIVERPDWLTDEILRKHYPLLRDAPWFEEEFAKQQAAEAAEEAERQAKKDAEKVIPRKLSPEESAELLAKIRGGKAEEDLPSAPKGVSMEDMDLFSGLDD